LGPGLDRALGQSFHLVGDNEVEIEVDCIAEPLALGARTVRIVEREKAWLGFFVANAAVLALEALGEKEPAGLSVVVGRWFEDDFSGFAVRSFDCVDDSRARFGRDAEAVDQNEHGLGKVDVKKRFWRGKFEDLPGLIEAVESGFAQVE